MTNEQINEFDAELDRLFPWVQTYEHLNFNRIYRLGKIAVFEMRAAKKSEPELVASATEEIQ